MPRLRWTVENLTLDRVQEDEHFLYDRNGVAFYKYPYSDKRATFTFTGTVDWQHGQAWSREKEQGLIPYLNKALKEYEDAFDREAHGGSSV